jgi:IS30 family transposase
MKELMKKYTQLSEVQRYQIEALKKAKKEQKEIAAINRSICFNY